MPALGSKRWIWLAYLCSSAVMALNLYFITTWDNNAQPQSTTDKSSFYASHHDRRSYPFKVAICVIMKDEENYFEEWLDYHFAMGFDSIYVYDNSPNFDLKNWHDSTRNHATYKRVKVLHWLDDTVYNQINAYSDCVEKFGRSGPKNDYIAFIDVDEFFVIQSQKYTDIQGILTDYLVPYGGGLTVNWIFVGSDKSVSSPLPITKRNQYTAKVAHNVVKSIAKTSDYIEHKNPHGLTLKSPAEVHTTKYPGCRFKASSSTGASDHQRPSDILLLYHYRYRSEKEYIFRRCVRGEAASNTWCDDEGKGITEETPEHIQISPGEVFDDRPWQFLTSRVPKYRLYNEFEDFHSPSRSTLRGIIGG